MKISLSSFTETELKQALLWLIDHQGDLMFIKIWYVMWWRVKDISDVLTKLRLSQPHYILQLEPEIRKVTAIPTIKFDSNMVR